MRYPGEMRKVKSRRQREALGRQHLQQWPKVVHFLSPAEQYTSPHGMRWRLPKDDGAEGGCLRVLPAVDHHSCDGCHCLNGRRAHGCSNKASAAFMIAQ